MIETKPSIAFIDILGLGYDGSTLSKRGLGGSESSVILLARELVKIGFDVSVFNRCSIDDDTAPGTYEGVTYFPLADIKGCVPYDIIVSSRSIIPFARTDPIYNNILKTAKYKVLWMHDTFVQGSDHVVEKMLVDGAFDRVFTLSDFHTDYVTTCDHGARRMFEVLKSKIWQTRDGANAYFDYVDVSAKDPNLFVYNASVTKGMVPLVEDIWPRIVQQIPDARLMIIGGFYRFPDRKPDDQEKKWHELKARPNNKNITFTGIISQKEIAGILAKASFFLAPGAFPETFGISMLESMLYNTPIICCRFGALESTAVEQACYKIDYAIEPNSLFPHINKAEQINKYVWLVTAAYENRYLWQQKAHYCNIVKPIAGWDKVALQWKVHFHEILHKELDWKIDHADYQKAMWINQRVQKIFNLRFINPEQVV